MRRIDEIIVHCTASRENQPMTVKQIDNIHRYERHWANGIGYHKVIYLDGSIHDGRPIEMMGAHCTDGGHNRYSIGVVYVGGCAKDGKTASVIVDVDDWKGYSDAGAERSIGYTPEAAA